MSAVPVLTLALALGAAPEAAEGGVCVGSVSRGGATARLTVQVGERGAAAPVVLVVSVEGPLTLEVAPLRLDSAGAWEARVADSAALDGDRLTWTQRVRLSPLQPGRQRLPAVTARFRTRPDADWEEASWADILEDVRPPPPPEPLPPLPGASWKWWWAAGGLLVLSLAGLAVVRRRRRPARGPVSPEERALGELERLDAEAEVLGPGEFHGRLSAAVRRYLSERLGLAALQQTTPELLAAAAKLPGMTAERRERLADFLDRCDRGRFAPGPPSPQECHAVAALARTLIEPAPGTGT
jgi:hypothetical protein